MTIRSDDRIAPAISKSDFAIVKVASTDHEKISNVLNEMHSSFISSCNALGVPIKRGRSYNLPTITHAINFLLQHCEYSREDLERYIDHYAQSQAPEIPDIFPEATFEEVRA